MLCYLDAESETCSTVAKPECFVKIGPIRFDKDQGSGISAQVFLIRLIELSHI